MEVGGSLGRIAFVRRIDSGNVIRMRAEIHCAVGLALVVDGSEIIKKPGSLLLLAGLDESEGTEQAFALDVIVTRSGGGLPCLAGGARVSDSLLQQGLEHQQ